MSLNEACLASSLPNVDGRHQRSERTRQALIEAFMELLRRTPVMPKASQIAKEAGCSLRSVFERFTNLDALALAAADCVIVQGQAELVAPNVGADRATRIHSHVETRASVCEKWLPLWRLMAWQEHPELRERAAMVRSLILGRLKLMYEPELAPLAEPERDQTLKIGRAHV